MIILNKKIAEDFARKILGKIGNLNEKDFYLLHTKSVVDAVLILAQDKKVDKNSLEIAGWLHDIGYFISEKDHAQQSINILEKEGFEINNIIRDCILNHGSSGKPKTEEGKLLKIADKASIFNPDFVRLLLKQTKGKIKKEDLDFIQSTSKKAVELLGEESSLKLG